MKDAKRKNIRNNIENQNPHSCHLYLNFGKQRKSNPRKVKSNGIILTDFLLNLKNKYLYGLTYDL